MTQNTLYNNRKHPFRLTVSTALGDDIGLRFVLRDENGDNITTGTPTLFTLKVYDAPDIEEDMADMTLRATVPQADMTISLPNVDVTVEVSNDNHWASQTKGTYYAKLQGTMDTVVVTPHEFIIEVTD